MRFTELECVVLSKDIPEYSLEAGDVGTIVMVYGNDGFEVEFVTASGDTQALLTLSADDIRHKKPDEITTVRSLEKVG